MKIPMAIFIFFGLFLLGIAIISSCLIKSPRHDDKVTLYTTDIPESVRRMDPKFIAIKSSDIFIYKGGTALNLRQVKKFRVSNPWPYQYGIDAWIGWDCYTIKSGFSSREEAADWLEVFLQLMKEDI